MLVKTQKNNLSVEHLKFDVEKIDMFGNLGDKTAHLDNENIIEVPTEDRVMLIRKDTKEYISTVGGRYYPVNYWELAEKQAEGLEQSGLLKKGDFEVKDYFFEGVRKFRRDVTWKDLTIEPKVGDIVNFRQSCSSSLNGSWSTITDGTPSRLSCANGMVSPMWQLIFKFRHTVGFEIENLVNIFKVSTERFFEMEPYFNSMGNKSISKSEIEMALRETICKRKPTGKNKRNHNQKLLGWLLEQFDVESNELGTTLWAFYNTLTHWATHPELYDYKENTKYHNLAEKNKDKVLVFMRSPQWQKFMSR